MSRGKELRGQTLVLPGSPSGASTTITLLAYDTAFNAEFIGEAKYATPTSDMKWYITNIRYDSAFNAIQFATAANRRIIANANITSNVTYEITDGVMSIPAFLVPEIKKGDIIDLTPLTDPEISSEIVSIATSGTDALLTLSDLSINIASETVLGTAIIFTLNDYTTKDFNKRIWDFRELYFYE